jgi:1-phosphatidylinositol phosphodiesterase
MSQYPDDTLIVHMNIPGTHDADTWNYSLATQESLDHVTELANITQVDPRAYRCQSRSMIDMLDDGIRVFDLRYAFDVTNSTLVFWHGTGLVSETATVEDTLYGFYHWPDQHRTEAIFISFQYEGSTTPYGSNDAGVQWELLQILSSPAAQTYILQVWGALGTLGEARGKITLLKRFDFDQLPASYANALPGLHLSPNNWTDNSPNITLVYNTTTGATAYIEDYYQPLTPSNSTYEENIKWKVRKLLSPFRFLLTYLLPAQRHRSPSDHGSDHAPRQHVLELRVQYQSR